MGHFFFKEYLWPCFLRITKEADDLEVKSASLRKSHSWRMPVRWHESHSPTLWELLLRARSYSQDWGTQKSQALSAVKDLGAVTWVWVSEKKPMSKRLGPHMDTVGMGWNLYEVRPSGRFWVTGGMPSEGTPVSLFLLLFQSRRWDGWAFSTISSCHNVLPHHRPKSNGRNWPRTSRALVAHTCNPSYSGNRDQEDHGSKPAQANSSWDPILKNPS
jgi:hypothetical protein